MPETSQNLEHTEQQLSRIRSRIVSACEQAGRKPSEVTLIGASKTKPAALIQQFHQAGLKDIGENYLSEALEKQEQLSNAQQSNQTNSTICWHYIGQIQSNKTKQIANHFQWVHSVDRLKIAQRLSAQNEQTKPLNLLLQINLDDEQSKAGINLDQAKPLCQQISQLDNIQLRGFMAIPKPRENFDEQLHCLKQLSELKHTINTELGLNMDSISAGMSNDLEAAIAAGSTMVRIGSDLFGKRE